MMLHADGAQKSLTSPVGLPYKTVQEGASERERQTMFTAVTM